MGCQRFDSVKSVSNKRTPTVKPILVNPLMKNPNNSAVLAECAIQYDSPLVPIEVATRRADRIAKEKLKHAVSNIKVSNIKFKYLYSNTTNLFRFLY